MAEIEFPNYANVFAQSANAGRQMAQQRARQNALAMYAENPEGAENALMAAGDIESANALMANRLQRDRAARDAETVQRRKTALGKAANGDVGGADADALAAGDIELHQQIAGLGKERRDEIERRTNQVGGIAYNLLQIKDPDERQRVGQAAVKHLVEIGTLPAEAAANIDFSDQGLNQYVSQALTIQQQIDIAKAKAERDKPIALGGDSRLVAPDGRVLVGPGPKYEKLGAGETLLEVGGGVGGQAAGGQGGPRGLRNNNPLNLRPLADGQWSGQTGVDSGNYAVFDSPQAGWGAAHKNLLSYGRRGIDTVQGVINRWAPAGDNNDPQAYAGTVAKALGVAPDAKIDLNDETTRERLLTAMAAVENGQAVQSPNQGGGSRVVARGAPKPAKEVRQLSPQEIAAQGLPKGTIAQQDETGRISVISKPGDKITQDARQTASYAYRMRGATDTMNSLADQGIIKPSAQILVSENNGVARLVARNPKDARFVQAAQEWIMAKLRKESGAAIGAQELQNDLHTYFPEPGDSDDLIRQKAASRRRTEVGMLNQSRDAYEDQYGPVPREITSRVPGRRPARVDASGAHRIDTPFGVATVRPK